MRQMIKFLLLTLFSLITVSNVSCDSVYVGDVNLFASSNEETPEDFDPASISNLNVWLKASTDVFVDTAMTDPATDGETIRRWVDQSSNGYTVSAASDATPTIDTSAFSGAGAVVFDGVDDSMTFSNGSQAQPYTMVFVLNTLTNKANDALLVNGVFDNIIQKGSSGALRLNNNTANIRSSAISGEAIVVFRIDGASSEVYQNGGTADATANMSTDDFPTSKRIGSRFATNNNTTTMHFELGEMLIYEKALSDSELNDLGSHLGTKYGITWTDI